MKVRKCHYRKAIELLKTIKSRLIKAIIRSKVQEVNSSMSLPTKVDGKTLISKESKAIYNRRSE